MALGTAVGVFSFGRVFVPDGFVQDIGIDGAFGMDGVLIFGIYLGVTYFAGTVL